MGVKTGLESSTEEHRLRVHENSILRKIYGQKRNEITRGCRKLHNEELVLSAKCNQYILTFFRQTGKQEILHEL
jgi:hypothetical protein